MKASIGMKHRHWKEATCRYMQDPVHRLLLYLFFSNKSRCHFCLCSMATELIHANEFSQTSSQIFVLSTEGSFIQTFKVEIRRESKCFIAP